MIQGIKNACHAVLKLHPQSRCSSTKVTTPSLKEQWKKRKNMMFDNEKQRQIDDIGRLEKITVKFLSPTDEVHIHMNRNISTPFDVAKHISDNYIRHSSIALVNNIPWDMHKPLENDCEVRLLSMNMPKESPAVNASFWRSCSLILGSVIETAFKDNVQTYLHSFPWPNIRSGSFVYDAILDLPDWKPTKSELQTLSAKFVKLINNELPLERLVVREELALDMFQENPFKSKQIPEIAKQNYDNITLYRIGDHIDISKGPNIGNTNIVGRCTITSVHKIDSPDTDRMYRFQGVAIPNGILLNHFAYGILENRARELNTTMWMPQKLNEEYQDKIAASGN